MPSAATKSPKAPATEAPLPMYVENILKGMKSGLEFSLEAIGKSPKAEVRARRLRVLKEEALSRLNLLLEGKDTDAEIKKRVVKLFTDHFDANVEAMNKARPTTSN